MAQNLVLLSNNSGSSSSGSIDWNVGNAYDGNWNTYAGCGTHGGKGGTATSEVIVVSSFPKTSTLQNLQFWVQSSTTTATYDSWSHYEYVYVYIRKQGSGTWLPVYYLYAGWPPSSSSIDTGRSTLTFPITYSGNTYDGTNITGVKLYSYCYASANHEYQVNYHYVYDLQAWGNFVGGFATIIG